MDRIPEPELMIDPRQAEAYAKADFEAAHSLYPKLFAEKFPDRPEKALVLDLGCGPCDVTIRFAEANPGYKFHAVDGSQAMLKQGAAAIRAKGLSGRIRLIRGILPGVALPQESYDIILSTSFLHHLHDPNVFWQMIPQHARADTLVFVADLRRPRELYKAAGLVEKYMEYEPGILKRDFYNSLLAAFTPAEIRQQLIQAGLRQLQLERFGDRHVIVFGRIGGLESNNP